MYKKVFVDQCGYLPQMVKKVTFRTDRPTTFTVLHSDGTFAFEGKANKKIENSAAGEIDYIGDFSQLTAPGRYYISAEGFGESDPFVIGDDSYGDLWQKSMAFFYLQRCGMDLSKEFSGDFAHPACHTGIGHVYNSDAKREVTGGWHDAGDYGRYVGPGAMAVAQLLYAYERNRTLGKQYTNPSNKTSMPDFLEEIKYELDWMIKMQREDGALYHKATCRSFCDFILPQYETEDMILSPVSVTATADFAAACAMAVRFYRDFDSAYADLLEQVSRKAYEAMKAMALPGGFKNPSDITTGEYGDICDLDERYWAAAELYKAFGDENYREDFEALAEDKIYQGYGWADMGSYGNIAYLSAGRPIREDIAEKMKKAMIAEADKLLSLVNSDGYGTALPSKVYPWGSNLCVANNGLHLYDAYKLTGNDAFYTAACEQLHYLLGRNPMGQCYVTGCGSDAIRHPHHRPSGFLGKAMPGMLSGGPCNWLADAVAKDLFTKETPPAKCLADMTGSYSTNEVTIYWNSALMMLLASVTA